MAYTFVQDNASAGAGSSQSVAYSSSNTAKSLLIATVLIGTGQTFESLTDSHNTWLQVGTFQTVAGTSFQLGLFYVGSAVAGANTVDLEVGSVGFCGLYISEYSASGLASTLDSFTSATGTSATYAVGPITVAGNGELLLGTQYNLPNQTWTPGSQTSGFTIRENVGASAAFTGILDNVNGSSGSQSLSATYAVTPTAWVGIFAAFKTAASTFSISGSAGVAGATVSYTGTSSGSVTADGSGNYTIPGLANGSYTITPSLAGYTFSPTSQSETISGSNITGVNFTATPLPPPPSGGGSGLKYDYRLRF